MNFLFQLFYIDLKDKFSLIFEQLDFIKLYNTQLLRLKFHF